VRGPEPVTAASSYRQAGPSHPTDGRRHRVGNQTRPGRNHRLTGPGGQEPTPLRKRAGWSWIIAGAAMIPLAFFVLVIGLATTGLTLVYVSLALSVLAVPMILVGAFRMAFARRA